MQRKQSVVTILSLCLILSACSKDESSSGSDAVNTSKIQADKISEPTKNSGVLIENIETPEEGKDQLISPPTRSELRDLSEKTRETEDDAKAVIEQFDANLNNPEERKETQEKFKQMLPEYKEKMIQIGKAKLKESN